MEISNDLFTEVSGIAKSLDRRVRKLRAGNICPTTYELLSLGRLNTLLDEAYEQFIAQRDAQYEHDANREDDREGVSYENCRFGGC